MLSKQKLSNALRFLSMDAVQQANSGHPGAPMGMADIASVLWLDHLQHNPNNPKWFNRDRFVLSNGHSSMLLYSLLHLTGYDVSISDLKQFRQLHSKTPGHPEFGYTAGVEATTGPLGQGLANAVGMAIAEQNLASTFNREMFDIVNHFTYVFAGDGCMMEGVSHEVCSLAGALGLGKLIVFWDDNNVSIDGNVDGWWRDDMPQRFAAYGWQVIQDVNGHDVDAVDEAVLAAKTNLNQPTLICTKTIIGQGAPNKAGSHTCHGAPLGDAEIAEARQALEWEHPAFVIPDDVYQAWTGVAKGEQAEQAWQNKFKEYALEHPQLAAEFERRMQGELAADFDSKFTALIKNLHDNPSDLATRKSSYNVLCAIQDFMPELLGGSADLTPSNLTKADKATVMTSETAGNYIHYGVREFGMSAIMNGIALHGGFIPFGGTFLVFMEYARNAVRMAALMKQRSIFVYTHDSIGLGEDGPTHQPIEQIANLRYTPNMHAWRPCDQVETAVAWKMALMHKDNPTSLILSRQTLAQQPRTDAMLENIAKGGYVLHDSQQPELIIIATGSEVQLAMAAATKLVEQNIAARVVSMPSTDVFAAQDAAYQEQVLPKHIVKRVAIEAAQSDFWYKYVGLEGKVIGIDTFGESAPAPALFKHYGFDVDNVVKQITAWLV